MKKIDIRAGNGTLSFTITEDDGTVTTYPYPVKSDMSLPANLREAFREQPYLRVGPTDREGKILAAATLSVVSPIMLMPDDGDHDFSAADIDMVYGEVMTGHKGEEKRVIPIPELGVKAVFSVDSDLLLVVSDNFSNPQVGNVMIPQWVSLYKEHYCKDGKRRLFASFHDHMLDICSFEQHRIHFANTFEAQHAHDALYYILFVWKQLGMSQERDILYISGDVPHADWLMTRLSAYVRQTVNIEH